MHPAATVMTAGSTPWTPWSPSRTPSLRVALATVASTPPSTPPAPAACPWPRCLGPPSPTSLLEIWVSVGADVRPWGGPTTQTGGERSPRPLQSPLRAKATDPSCTRQAPAHPLAWRGAAVTHQGNPGKTLLLRVSQTPCIPPQSCWWGSPPETCPRYIMGGCACRRGRGTYEPPALLPVWSGSGLSLKVSDLSHLCSALTAKTHGHFYEVLRAFDP